MDLTEVEDIKKRWQEYTEELYEKDLHDPDNHDSVITHILDCEAKMALIKDRNCLNLTEAEDTKKRWQEYTEELYKKDLHDPDNHDGVMTHLEPDILEWEVKWALESITTNKASEVMEFQLSYFKSWMMPSKCCTQYASKFGKLSSGHRTGKGQFSFQSQRKEMPKNAQTTIQLHSSHMLVK